jgi:hypothetical protein
MAERFKTNHRVLEIACQYLGTVEKPVNRTIFGEWFGWNGVAWCAIFVSFVQWFAGVKVAALQTLKGCAYVPLFVEHAKKMGQWRPKSSGYKPRPGDLIIFWFTTRPDHIGFVEALYDDGSVMTIEGNTNAAGSRTGGMVARLRRRTRIHGYIEVDRPAEGGVDLAAVRRWVAGVCLSKLQGVRTKVPTDNSYNEDIKLVQEALNIVRGAGLKVDGVYGDATALHVIGFQRDCRSIGLKVSDPTAVFGEWTKWWLCVSLERIRDGKAI